MHWRGPNTLGHDDLQSWRWCVPQGGCAYALVTLAVPRIAAPCIAAQHVCECHCSHKLIGQISNVLCTFSCQDPIVQLRLLKNYCLSLYECELCFLCSNALHSAAVRCICVMLPVITIIIKINIVHIVHNTHTHTRLTFNGPFSGTTRVSRYPKGKTNLDFTEARDSEWQWHQLGHMQVCTSLQTDNHASTSPLSFLQAGCPSCRPANSVKALMAKNCTQEKKAKTEKTTSCNL